MNLCLFDLDQTLLPQDSDHAWGQFMVELGWAKQSDFARKNDEFFAQYTAGVLNLDEYVAFTTGVWRVRDREEVLRARERFMTEVIVPQLHACALDLVHRHFSAGDLVAIVTATNEFVTAPIAQQFGVSHLIAVQLERDAQGDYTGAILGTPSFREGKVTRVQAWLRSLGRSEADFAQRTVYSDSTNDLPLLEWASHPVATNPSPELRQIARDRAWPVIDLFVHD